MLGVKSGEQGDKSVSLMRVVPKPSHAVCFRSWANSHNTRVCVSEQSGVQTSARRVSENTRVCGVLTKAKKGAGSRQPLAVSRRCFTHRAPSVTHPGISIGHTQLTYRATHYEGITTARRWRRIICATEGMAHGIFFHLRSYLRRVQTVESRMGKHPDRRPRGSVCAPVTTPACAVPAEILGGGVNSVSSTHLSCDGMNLSRS